MTFYWNLITNIETSFFLILLRSALGSLKSSRGILKREVLMHFCWDIRILMQKVKSALIQKIKHIAFFFLTDLLLWDLYREYTKNSEISLFFYCWTCGLARSGTSQNIMSFYDLILLFFLQRYWVKWDYQEILVKRFLNLLFSPNNNVKICWQKTTSSLSN